MNTSASNRRLRMLLLDIREGKLIPRPEFQRRLVWTQADKRNFIRTVLEGYPFPEIYIAAGDVNPETAEGKEMLVDGQQRLTTLLEYFLGASSLTLGKEISPYSNLNDQTKRSFLEYEVVVRDLGQMGIESIVEIFTRINSTGYSLNAMEINNARYNGEFKKFGEEIAGHPIFEVNRVFSPSDIRRMGDLRFVLTFIITIMSAYFNRDDEIEKFLREYNDAFDESDRLRTELNRIFAFIMDLEFDPSHMIWRKNDLLSLIVELHRAIFKSDYDLDLIEVRDRLSRFYQQVSESNDFLSVPNEWVVSFARLSQQATNDRSSRIGRGEIMYRVIVGL